MFLIEILIWNGGAYWSKQFRGDIFLLKMENPVSKEVEDDHYLEFLENNLELDDAQVRICNSHIDKLLHKIEMKIKLWYSPKIHKALRIS